MTDAKTLEREKIAAVIRKSITDYYQDNYEKRFLVVGQNALVQEAVEKGADIAASAIQSLRASGTGEGYEVEVRDSNWEPKKISCYALAEWICEQATVERNGAIQRIAEAIKADRKGAAERAVRATLRASGERGSSSSGLSANTGINDPWLPIETAPKDGTPCLVYVPGKKAGVQYVAWYGQQNCFWTFYVASGPNYTDAGREKLGVAPTHWKPLDLTPPSGDRTESLCSIESPRDHEPQDTQGERG